MTAKKSMDVIAAFPNSMRTPKSIVRQFYQAIIAQDFQAMDSLLSPNFTYVSPDGRLSRIEFQTMLRASLEGTALVKRRSISVTAEEDRVVDEIEFSFEMDGREFVGRYCSVCVFEDGLLYELRTYGGVTHENNSDGYQPVWQRA
jgi:ketosteroid isomerase-like protein